MMTKKRKFVGFWKWLIFLLMAVVLLSLQTAPGLFVAFGVKPVFIIPFAVCFSIFFEEKEAAVMGLFCGAIWDAMSSQIFGFSSLVLMICCIIISLASTYFIREHVLNAVFMTAGTLLIYYSVEFLFRYVIWGYKDIQTIFFHQTLPVGIYTLIITPIIYYLCRFPVRKIKKMILN